MEITTITNGKTRLAPTIKEKISAAVREECISKKIFNDAFARIAIIVPTISKGLGFVFSGGGTGFV